jgi:hypothetical protein
MKQVIFAGIILLILCTKSICEYPLVCEYVSNDKYRKYS